MIVLLSIILEKMAIQFLRFCAIAFASIPCDNCATRQPTKKGARGSKIMVVYLRLSDHGVLLVQLNLRNFLHLNVRALPCCQA